VTQRWKLAVSYGTECTRTSGINYFPAAPTIGSRNCQCSLLNYNLAARRTIKAPKVYQCELTAAIRPHATPAGDGQAPGLKRNRGMMRRNRGRIGVNWVTPAMLGRLRRQKSTRIYRQISRWQTEIQAAVDCDGISHIVCHSSIYSNSATALYRQCSFSWTRTKMAGLSCRVQKLEIELNDLAKDRAYSE